MKEKTNAHRWGVVGRWDELGADEQVRRREVSICEACGKFLVGGLLLLKKELPKGIRWL